MREILNNAGTGPAPRRTGPGWSLFLRSQAEAILACDFFTADLPDGTQAYVLAVIEHATRRIRILGVTLHPTGEWTTQQARNLMMDPGEQAHQVKFMIRDRGRTAPPHSTLSSRRTPDRRMPAELLDRAPIWNQAHPPTELRRPAETAARTGRSLSSTVSQDTLASVA